MFARVSSTGPSSKGNLMPKSAHRAPHTTHIPVHNCFVSCVMNKEGAPWNVLSHLFTCYCFHMIHCVRNDELRSAMRALLYARVYVMCEEWWMRSTVQALWYVITLRQPLHVQLTDCTVFAYASSSSCHAPRRLKSIVNVSQIMRQCFGNWEI